MKKISQISGVGQFINFTAKGDITFKKLNLIYAENAMGKSTLANIFRSLSKNEPKYILTKTDNENYRIEIVKENSANNYIFDRNGWKNIENIQNNIEIYDSVFINENINSGFTITSDHKKHLTKLIIGEEEIQKNKLIEEKKTEIEEKNKEIDNFFKTKIKNKDVDCTLRFEEIGDFNKLDISDITNLDCINTKILEQKNKIDIIKNRDNFLNKENIPYSDFNLNKPKGISDFKNILEKTIENIEKDSEYKVQEHLKKFQEKENLNKNWLNIGLNAINEEYKCPFCGSDIKGNELIKAYQDFFNLEYNNFKKELSEYKNFGQTIRSNFSEIYSLVDKTKNFYDTFWSKYFKLDILENLTFEEYLKKRIEFNFTNFNDIEEIINKVDNLYNSKEKSLLEKINEEQMYKFIIAYNKYIDSYLILNKIVKEFFEKVNEFKKSLGVVGNIKIEEDNLIKLEQKKYKYCIKNNFDYDNIKIIKNKELEEFLNKDNEIEKLKKDILELREEMNKNIKATIIKYKNDINEILEKFNTNFSINLEDLKFNTTEPNSELSIRIGNKQIKQTNKNTDIYEKETIGNALSEGDKNSLAFAFFIAKLNHDSELKNKIIIFDDPMCSLDKSRKTETINQIFYIFKKAKKVFVLSHDSYFLEKILNRSNSSGIKSDNKILHIFFNGENGSNIEEFDLENENRSEYIKNFYILKNFCDDNKDLKDNNISVARTIRPYLEGLLRRIYPDKFGKNQWLGDFIEIIRNNNIFKEKTLQELELINDFSKEFHHDHCSDNIRTNINFTELQGFVRRTLKFIDLVIKN